MSFLKIALIYILAKPDYLEPELAAKFWEDSAPFRQRLFYLALGYLQSIDEAEDIVHETLEKGAKNWSSFEHKSGIYTWLVRILINNCKDFHKKRSRKKETIFSENASVTNGLDINDVSDQRQNFSKKIELSEAGECLINIVNTLDEKYRATVFLRYFEEMKYGEIAQTLAISSGTVKSRLNEARRQIRVQMEEAGFGGDIFGL